MVFTPRFIVWHPTMNVYVTGEYGRRMENVWQIFMNAFVYILEIKFVALSTIVTVTITDLITPNRVYMTNHQTKHSLFLWRGKLLKNYSITLILLEY